MITPRLIKVSHSGQSIKGTIHLNRSKSISNRVLIIKALSGKNFPIHHLSNSDDTQSMVTLLKSKNKILDAHHSGTTYRFLCSYLALQPGSHILTGSERMKQRPIKLLVDALRVLGADIEYLEKEGFPPLKINEMKNILNNQITIPGNISSQYISSLLLIAPVLSDGLRIVIDGELVSRPYVNMTIEIMRYFGAQVLWEGNTIKVSSSGYESKEFSVEADWSAASYYYSIAALSSDAEISLVGLSSDSLQGDHKISDIMIKLGITTQFNGEDTITITKSGRASSLLEYNFIEQPDLAQTCAIACAGSGAQGLFSGLMTLSIKETDRVQALKNELSKYGVFLSKIPSRFMKNSHDDLYMIEGTATENPEAHIETYNDHRMAMAFAPLALKFPIIIQDPGVVSKSYPQFWEDLKKLGFIIDELAP